MNSGVRWRWLGRESLVVDEGSRRMVLTSDGALQTCGSNGLLVPFDPGSEIGRAIAAVPQLCDAVDYVLTRAQTDPDLGYLVGPMTETFERLCAAEAAVRGEDVDAVKKRRGRDLQPEYRKRRATVLELQDRLHRAESALDELRGVTSDDPFDLASAARRALKELAR